MGALWVPAVVAAAAGLLLISGSTTAAAASDSRIVKLSGGRRVLVRAGAAGRVLVYFHGHDAKIETVGRTLVPLWARSYEWTIVAPQLGPLSEPGDLSKSGGLKAMLAELGLLSGSPVVDTLAHSGGFKALAPAINSGGLPISNVGLLDALYGEGDTFFRFSTASPSRHFANIFGPSTSDQSLALAKRLAAALPPGEAVLALDEMPLKDWRAALSHKAATIRSRVAHQAVPAAYGGIVLEAFVR